MTWIGPIAHCRQDIWLHRRVFRHRDQEAMFNSALQSPRRTLNPDTT
jgi:hypothetical protein